MNIKYFFIFVSVSLFLGGCASGGIERDTASIPTSNDGVEEKYIVVDVYYGTDRKPLKSSKPTERYGTERGMGFEYGIAEVSIPGSHKTGELESPVWWKFEFREDPNNHIVLFDISPHSRDLFFNKIKSDMSNLDNDDVFVFIHGFNVTFEDSVRRTAQLAHDLGYPGIPVAYSWPSQGSASPLGYTTDSNYSDWSFPHLKKFLVDIKNQTKANKIHVLAHSMGNKVLTKAIKALDNEELRLNQVILAAPDIDAEIFKEQIAPHLSGKAERYSMYVSAKDAALILSDRIQKGNRAGLAREEIVIVDGVDTIDASSIDTSILGHSYYGDERELIMDIYHVIKNNIAPVVSQR